MHFIDRIQPASKSAGFRRANDWVWGGSVIPGDDGQYHMFASMWTKEVPFSRCWLTNSRVVHAVSEKADGEYTYQKDVLPPRGEDYWDGRMTHNPTIHRCEDRYLLFYTGTTYEGPAPGPDHLREDESGFYGSVRANQRIGLAVAEDLAGPWKRFDEPILETKPNSWDELLTTNPAPCVREDGSVLLFYKGTGGKDGTLKYGVAGAESWEDSFERLKDAPLVFSDDPGASYEDAYVWRQDGTYHMIFNDLSGHVTGERRAGGHAISDDGMDWELADPPKAYSRTVQWDDGTETTLGNLERPQVLIQEGRPTHLFCAAADNQGWFADADNTWCQTITLR